MSLILLVLNLFPGLCPTLTTFHLELLWNTLEVDLKSIELSDNGTNIAFDSHMIEIMY